MSSTTSTTRAASHTEVVSRSLDRLPDDFDASAHPIIARHWFGVGPLRPIGEVAAEVVADLRFRRKIQRLHGLGPRVLAELLAELSAERGIRTVVDKKLDHYVELEPEVIEAAGGDRFWPAPVRSVRDG